MQPDITDNTVIQFIRDHLTLTTDCQLTLLETASKETIKKN